LGVYLGGPLRSTGGFAKKNPYKEIMKYYVAAPHRIGWPGDSEFKIRRSSMRLEEKACYVNELI
jgi:hypothetical protein